MAPSGDDGVKSVEEGLALLHEAARRGTAVQYATPHVNRMHPLTAARAEQVREAVAELDEASAAFGLCVELGWELGPEPSLLERDPRDLRLGGLEAVLLEFPLPHTRIPDLEL